MDTIEIRAVCTLNFYFPLDDVFPQVYAKPLSKSFSAAIISFFCLESFHLSFRGFHELRFQGRATRVDGALNMSWGTFKCQVVP